MSTSTVSGVRRSPSRTPPDGVTVTEREANVSEQQWRDRFRLSFGGSAVEYDRVRPSFPVEALDWIVPEGARDAVDVGAGTGKFTRLLAEYGLRVIAVEPDAGMLAQLHAVLPKVPVWQGSGEHIPLPDASADLVTFAQAWHWVDPVAGSLEVARVLRPGGRIVMIWNQEATYAAEWMVQAQRVESPGWADASHSADELPTLHEPFGQVEFRRFDWTERLSKQDYIDRVFTHSAYLTLDDDTQASEREWMTHVLATHPDVADLDVIEIRHATDCFRATRG